MKFGSVESGPEWLSPGRTGSVICGEPFNALSPCRTALSPGGLEYSGLFSVGSRIFYALLGLSGVESGRTDMSPGGLDVSRIFSEESRIFGEI